MYATDYLEKGFLNVLRGISFNAPPTLYVGLYLTNPTESGISGSEINYPTYKRQIIEFSSAAEKDKVIQVANLNQVNFPQAMIDAGTVSYIGISDSPTAGNMLAYGKLSEDLDVSAGEAPILMKEEVIVHSEGQLSKAFKMKLLNVFNKKSIQGIIPHLSLFNGNPESGGSELLGDNYKRVKISFSVPSDTQTGQSIMSNEMELLFPRPTTDWGNWSTNVIMSDSSMGEPVFIYDRGITKLLKKGNMPRVEIGALKVALN